MMPSSIEPPRATPELEIVLVVQRASTTPSGTGFDLRRRVHRHSNARAVVRGKVAEDEPDENRDCEYKLLIREERDFGDQWRGGQ